MQIKLARITSNDDPDVPAYVAQDLTQVQKVCDMLSTRDTVWSHAQIARLVERAAKGEFDMCADASTVTITLREGVDPIAAAMAVDPAAVIALFKVQAIYSQRRKDITQPKAELRVSNLTVEQAQRIADDLCCYVSWGTERITPAINA